LMLCGARRIEAPATGACVPAVRVSVDPTPAVAPGKLKAVVVVPPPARSALVPALPTVAFAVRPAVGSASAGDARSRCSRRRQEATLKSRGSRRAGSIARPRAHGPLFERNEGRVVKPVRGPSRPIPCVGERSTAGGRPTAVLQRRPLAVICRRSRSAMSSLGKSVRRVPRRRPGGVFEDDHRGRHRPLLRGQRDTYALHVDEEYAKTTRFGQRAAHGMLTASLLSTVNGAMLKRPAACMFRRRCTSGGRSSSAIP